MSRTPEKGFENNQVRKRNGLWVVEVFWVVDGWLPGQSFRHRGEARSLATSHRALGQRSRVRRYVSV